MCFYGIFGPKYQNSQFERKVATETNSKTQSSMLVFTFSVFDRKYPFWVCLVKKKKSKLSVYAEIWHLDYDEYAEFNGLVHFFCFRQKILFWGKFNLKKRQISQFKLKFVT